MAEVLGAVASGVALAGVTGRLVTSTMKLKQFMDAVRDVPETLRLNLEYLETLAPTLEEMRRLSMDINDQYSGMMLGGAQRGLTLATSQCEKACIQLERLVEDAREKLENSKGIRKTARQVRIVFRKEVMAEYERRLDAAVRVMILAQSTFTM